jgi:hypothetical protein
VPLSELEAALARPAGPERGAALARIRAQMGVPVGPEERERIRESITLLRGSLDAQLVDAQLMGRFCCPLPVRKR